MVGHENDAIKFSLGSGFLSSPKNSIWADKHFAKRKITTYFIIINFSRGT